MIMELKEGNFILTERKIKTYKFQEFTNIQYILKNLHIKDLKKVSFNIIIEINFITIKSNQIMYGYILFPGPYSYPTKPFSY